MVLEALPQSPLPPGEGRVRGSWLRRGARFVTEAPSPALANSVLARPPTPTLSRRKREKEDRTPNPSSSTGGR